MEIAVVHGARQAGIHVSRCGCRTIGRHRPAETALRFGTTGESVDLRAINGLIRNKQLGELLKHVTMLLEHTDGTLLGFTE